jgi:hypothetical protein
VAGVRIDALPLSRRVAWEVGTQQGKAQKRGKAREVNDTAQRGRGSQELFACSAHPCRRAVKVGVCVAVHRRVRGVSLSGTFCGTVS